MSSRLESSSHHHQHHIAVDKKMAKQSSTPVSSVDQTVSIQFIHTSDTPDTLAPFQPVELSSDVIDRARTLVDSALELPFIAEHAAEMKRQLPYTWDHELTMSTMAGVLMLHYNRSVEEQEIAVTSGLVHDNYKLKLPLDWDAPLWTPEYAKLHEEEVKSHPTLGAERFKDIAPTVVHPIALHHAFQGDKSYPYLPTYLQEHDVPDLTIPRSLAVVDMVEAILTRMERQGKVIRPEEVAQILAVHTYNPVENVYVTSFTEEEIRLALSAYLKLRESRQQVAA